MINAMPALPPDMGDRVAAVSGKLVIQPQVAPPVITPDSLEIVKESERGTPRAVDQISQ